VELVKNKKIIPYREPIIIDKKSFNEKISDKKSLKKYYVEV